MRKELRIRQWGNVYDRYISRGTGCIGHPVFHLLGEGGEWGWLSPHHNVYLKMLAIRNAKNCYLFEWSYLPVWTKGLYTCHNFFNIYNIHEINHTSLHSIYLKWQLIISQVSDQINFYNVLFIFVPGMLGFFCTWLLVISYLCHVVLSLMTSRM